MQLVLDAPMSADLFRELSHFRRQARQIFTDVSGLASDNDRRANHHHQRGQSRPPPESRQRLRHGECVGLTALVPIAIRLDLDAA